MIPRGGLKAANHLWEIRIRNFRNHQAKNVALAGRKPAGVDILVVVQLVNYFEYTLSCFIVEGIRRPLPPTSRTRILALRACSMETALEREGLEREGHLTAGIVQYLRLIFDRR